MVLVLIIGDLHIIHTIFPQTLSPREDKTDIVHRQRILVRTPASHPRRRWCMLRSASVSCCIRLVHGHQCVPIGDLDALSAIARQMDVDVLISGHTHIFQAIEYDGRFFVNPGSATGAWMGLHNSGMLMASLCDPTPSFALMDIQGAVVVTYVYQLVEGEVRVKKIECRKEVEAAKPVVPPPPITQSNSTYSSASGGFETSGPGNPQAQSVW
ncbi:Metallo-dependent phosphatase-like protein [Tylopilus felleus]